MVDPAENLTTAEYFSDFLLDPVFSFSDKTDTDVIPQSFWFDFPIKKVTIR